jgi:hypothetical protein
MARVTIYIRDVTDDEGDEQAEVEIGSTPEFPENPEDLTQAQFYGMLVAQFLAQKILEFNDENPDESENPLN